MPRSKKFVSAALLVGIVLIVSVLATASYFWGKDMSNKDTSAAVPQEEDSEVSTEETSGDPNYSCGYSSPEGRIYACVPIYVVKGQKYTVVIHYMPRVGDPALPSWDIKIGNERTRSRKFSINVPFESGRNEFKVLVKNTNFEGDQFEKSYTPILKTEKFSMPEITIPKEVSVGTDGISMHTDLAQTIQTLGLDINNIDIYWQVRGFNSAICYAHAYTNYSIPSMMEGSVLGRKPGVCKFTVVASIVTKSADGEHYDKVYKSTKVISVKVKASSVTPTPTVHSEVSPTPTVAVMVSPTPTVVGMAAIKLEPAYKYIAPGAQEVISIVSNTTVQNVSALQIRLTLTGATVLDGSYKTSTEEGYLSLPACSNSLYTNPTEVCVDVAKINPGGTGYIQTGDLIGQFTITPDANVVYSRIQTGSENAYMISDYQLVYSGNVNLGTYVTNPAVTPVP